MLLRVVPERGACRAGPIIIAWRAFVSGDAFLAPDRETDAEPVAGSRYIDRWSRADLAQMVRCHERDGCGAQDAVAIEGAAILQHLQKLRVIERGGNHALAACFPFGREPRIAQRRGAHDL